METLNNILRDSKSAGVSVHADLEGAKVAGGSVPPDIMVTSSRPDLVIINYNTTPTSVYLVELTCPFTRNIEAANARKRIRYEFLTKDIEDRGYKCSNLPLEIGSRGHISSRNRETLVFLCHTFGIGKFGQVIKNCSKLSLLGSYSIFNARSVKDWGGAGYLKP